MHYILFEFRSNLSNLPVKRFNVLELLSFPKMKCRLCLFECSDENAIGIFENNEETNWSKLIVKYLFFEVKENDYYSTKSCRDCLKHLEDFHKFFQCVEERQKLLQNELKWVIEQNSIEVQSGETEESLLDVKYLVPEQETTIENPLSPAASKNMEIRNDDQVLDEDSRNRTIKAIKPESKKRKTSKTSQNGRKCIRTASTKINIQDMSHKNTEEPTKRERVKQNQTAEEEKLGDELIANHIQLKCELCGLLMETFKSLKIHFRKKHSTDGFVICCGRRFRLRCLLLDHIQVHLNPNHLKCETCNKILKSRERLELHKAIKHSDRQQLKHACTLCHKRFACSSNLNAHMLVHTKERNHICEICNKGFKSTIFLKAHMQSHKETKPFVCETCGREYRNKPSFERHVAEHEGRLKEPTDQCVTCGKWFTFDGLQRHIRSHKLEDVECKICGKILKSKNALRGHMDYSHRRQQTLACTFCEKTFKRPSVYKEHIAMHTGQKDYHCAHCPREFRSKANMYAHVKKSHIEEWAQAQLMRFKGPSEQPKKKLKQ